MSLRFVVATVLGISLLAGCAALDTRRAQWITLHLHIQTITTPTSIWWTIATRSRISKLSVETGQVQTGYWGDYRGITVPALA
jgi:hypothetical protein